MTHYRSEVAHDNMASNPDHVSHPDGCAARESPARPLAIGWQVDFVVAVARPSREKGYGEG